MRARHGGNSVEDAMMRDAVARLEQAAHVNPKWLWDAKEARAVLRSSVEGTSAVVSVVIAMVDDPSWRAVFFAPGIGGQQPSPQTAMAAVEATINGHTKEKP